MNKTIYKIGFRSGMIAFISTLVYTIVQLLQMLGFVSYPWDEILIYGSSLSIVVPFMLAILALHYITPATKKFWTHEKWVRTIFLVHALVTPLIAFVYFYPNFSESLLLIGLPWGVTAPMAMLLLALLFKSANQIPQQ